MVALARTAHTRFCWPLFPFNNIVSLVALSVQDFTALCVRLWICFFVVVVGMQHYVAFQPETPLCHAAASFWHICHHSWPCVLPTPVSRVIGHFHRICLILRS